MGRWSAAIPGDDDGTGIADIPADDAGIAIDCIPGDDAGGGGMCGMLGGLWGTTAPALTAGTPSGGVFEGVRGACPLTVAL